MYENVPTAVASIVEKTFGLVVNQSPNATAASNEQAVAAYVEKLTRTMMKAMKTEVGAP